MSELNYYTTKEAAVILKKSPVTINHYVRTGRLTPIEDLWGGHRGYLFDKEAVEQLKAELERNDTAGMLTGEAAAYLKVTRAVLQSYLQEDKIPHQKTTWRNREVVTIQKEDLDLFLEQHQERVLEDRLKQRTFYDRKKKQAFYQRFSSASVREARLIRVESGKWAFLLMDTGAVTSYEEGIYKHELKPDYTVSFGKRTGTPGYAKLSLPLKLAFTRKFMDLLYQQFDVSNVYMDIKHEDKILVVYMKDALFNNVKNVEALARFLESNIEDGFVAANSNQIRIESAKKSLSIHLPAEIKMKIKKLADEQNTSMQEISSKIIEAYFTEKQDQQP